MTVNDSYDQVVERILQSDDIEELRQTVAVYREGLSVVAHQREELKVELEIACKRSEMWFHNFSCTQYALICTRLSSRKTA